jgi:hypothetical protein
MKIFKVVGQYDSRNWDSKTQSASEFVQAKDEQEAKYLFQKKYPKIYFFAVVCFEYEFIDGILVKVK